MRRISALVICVEVICANSGLAVPGERCEPVPQVATTFRELGIAEIELGVTPDAANLAAAQASLSTRREATAQDFFVERAWQSVVKARGELTPLERALHRYAENSSRSGEDAYLFGRALLLLERTREGYLEMQRGARDFPDSTWVRFGLAAAARSLLLRHLAEPVDLVPEVERNATYFIQKCPEFLPAYLLLDSFPPGQGLDQATARLRQQIGEALPNEQYSLLPVLWAAESRSLDDSGRAARKLRQDLKRLERNRAFRTQQGARVLLQGLVRVSDAAKLAELAESIAERWPGSELARDSRLALLSSAWGESATRRDITSLRDYLLAVMRAIEPTIPADRLEPLVDDGIVAVLGSLKPTLLQSFSADWRQAGGSQKGWDALALILARAANELSESAGWHRASGTFPWDQVEAIQGAVGPPRTLVVHLWASWCAPCLRELDSLRDWAAKNAKPPFELILLTFDEDAEAVRRLLKSKSIGLHVWMLTGAGVRVPTLPSSWIVTGDGEIAWELLGSLVAHAGWEEQAAQLVIQRTRPGGSTP